MNTYNPFERYDHRLSNIEALQLEVLQLLRKQSIQDCPISEPPVSLTEAAEFLGISQQTLYQNVSKKKVPFRKRFGRLYFFKAELLAYLDGKEVSRD